MQISDLMKNIEMAPIPFIIIIVMVILVITLTMFLLRKEIEK